ncbi:MAG: hypothetical protein WA372_09800 [Candidatus Sulfotelmatobacter sp.]
MLVIFERQAGQFEFASALDVHPVITVDQNVGDGVVLEQRLERAEAEDLIKDFAGKALALGEAERNDFIVDGIADENENFFAGAVTGGAAELFEVETIEDFAVQVGLYLLVLAVLEGLQVGNKVLNFLDSLPQ